MAVEGGPGGELLAVAVGDAGVGLVGVVVHRQHELGEVHLQAVELLVGALGAGLVEVDAVEEFHAAGS